MDIGTKRMIRKKGELAANYLKLVDHDLPKIIEHFIVYSINNLNISWF